MSWIYSISLIILVLIPIIFAVVEKKMYYFPSLFYAASILVYLLIGTLFFKIEYSFSLMYYITIILAIVPVYLVMFSSNDFLKNYNDNRTIEYDERSIKATRYIFWLIWLISIIGIVQYIIQYKNIPIMQSLLLGSSAEIYEYRMNITYNNVFKRYEIFFYVIPIFAAVLGHYLYRVNEIKLVTNILSIFLAALAGLFFLHKSFIIFLLLKIFIVEFYLKRVKIQKFIFLVVMVVVGNVITYSFYMRGYPITYMLEQISNRIFGSYSYSLDFVLQHFPEKNNFLWGSSFPNPGGIFPYESVYLSNYIMRNLGGKSEGTIPVGVFGEMYSNFGVLGLLLATVLVTVLLFLLTNLFLMVKHSPLGFIIWLSLCFEVMNLSTQSIFVLLDIKNLIFYSCVLIFYLFIKNSSKTIKGKINVKKNHSSHSFK